MSPFSKGGLGVADLSNPPFLKGAGGIFLLPEQAAFSNHRESTTEFAKKTPANPIIYFYDGKLVLVSKKDCGADYS